MKLVLTSLLAARYLAQHPGDGIAKTTWACNDPIPGWTFMKKYFPDQDGPAECENNVCDCTTDGKMWEIQQGRVNLDIASSSDVAGPPGGSHGFGMHLVNVSAHLTTGGMSVAAVEDEFTKKLGDMTRFDSFMDHNVQLLTADLDSYAKTFDADKVPYLSYASHDGHGLFVRVPSSALVIELMGSNSTLFSGRGVRHVFEEPRSTPAKRAQLGQGASLSLGAVNRAVSAAVYDALDAFYVDGIGATLASKYEEGDVKRKCFLWPGAGDDVCFATRPDANTSTAWKVGDFEKMLHAVHAVNLKNPLCAMDKWTDVHYAVDTHDTNSKVVPLIESTKAAHFCFSTTQLHYLVDPTGMSIQLDMTVADASSVCGSSDRHRRLQPPGPPGPGGNPACSFGTCS